MQKFYAVKNKNDFVRLSSSSGGVFYELANYVIEKKGIVYGAAYDDEHNVNHIRIEKKSDLNKLFGSKYTESCLGKCFEQVKNDLLENKYVLFSGTPCQVSGIKAYTKNVNTDRLLLVDIICHGVPEKKFYNEYLKYMEKKYQSKITKINMRYKDEKIYNKNITQEHIALGAVEPHVMMIQFENGAKYCKESDFDIFYQLFDLFIRKSCFKCPFASLKRCSDITIGDFHEFSSKLGKFNDGNGVSLVITNSDKGNSFISKLKTKFEIIEKSSNECLQPAITAPAKKPEKYDLFIEDYQSRGFEFIVDKYRKKGIKFTIKKVLYKINLYKIIMKYKNKIRCDKNEFENK